MSQHHFDTTHNGQPVTITMGYDRPLRGFFMTIGSSGEASIYCNLDDPELVPWGGLPPILDPFLHRLRELGLQVPAGMIAEVRCDQVKQVGNRVVVHDGGGPMLPRAEDPSRLARVFLGPICVTINDSGEPFGLAGNESDDLVLRRAHYGIEVGRAKPEQAWTAGSLERALQELAGKVEAGAALDAYVGHSFLGTTEV